MSPIVIKIIDKKIVEGLTSTTDGEILEILFVFMWGLRNLRDRVGRGLERVFGVRKGWEQGELVGG